MRAGKAFKVDFSHGYHARRATTGSDCFGDELDRYVFRHHWQRELAPYTCTRGAFGGEERYRLVGLWDPSCRNGAVISRNRAGDR